MHSTVVRAFALISIAASTLAAPYKRNPPTVVQKTVQDGVVFTMGNNTYLADTRNPRVTGATIPSDLVETKEDLFMPMVVISTDDGMVDGQCIKDTIQAYLDGDDVFSLDFMEGVYMAPRLPSVNVTTSAFNQFSKMDVKHIFMNHHHAQGHKLLGALFFGDLDETSLPPGPYILTGSVEDLQLVPVYRLYEDAYRDFLYGTYEAADGSYTPLELTYPAFRYPAIPVPSRIYSWNDPRPFAGFRVGIKDLYDMKGLVTTGGSQAWAYINEPATSNAPSIQRIVDLGGVLVGKQKLAQFASGANPWQWQEEHYPFNPRGDGWLTCSASSSGGGCSIAAYDWLDYAIGSDTGSSMRRPAAVSGTYGNRPSQGLMSLEQVLPLGGATDTAGVFSRDPHRGAYFAKHWYTPSLHQSTNVTGLSALTVPDTDNFPKTILYPTDYLPLNNSAAQPILEAFIGNMSALFNMEVKRLNFTATVQNASDSIAANSLSSDALGIINRFTQWDEVAEPLISRWGELFDGRFPPIDPARREGWRTFNETAINIDTYNLALEEKNAAAEWYESNIQFSTPDSCSESVMLYDIGTGGLPSYREEDLINGNPNASFLAVTPEGAAITGAGICPIYGCADFTVPIGQVEYQSEVTFHTEFVPVTINMVVKRGCDFVLYNMIEKLADAGVIGTVKTGRTAY
ncbi:amidase signature enzyme [Hortaea werneckii]|nr:amidase signature enzyme [Hortaea werneckii]